MTNEQICDRSNCAAGIAWERRGRITGRETELKFVENNCRAENFAACPHYNFRRDLSRALGFRTLKDIVLELKNKPAP